MKRRPLPLPRAAALLPAGADRNLLILPILLALLLTLLAGAPAFAASRVTTQSGNWSAPGTWGGNPAPVAGDDVIINGNFTVTVDVANAACLSLQLGGSTLGTGAGTVAFAAASHLTVAGAVVLGVTNNTPGSVTMTSGGTFTCEGFVDNRLGTWTPGTGTIELTATNTIPSNNNIDFNNLNVRAGSATLSRNMSILGNLNIFPGATLNCGAFVLTCAGNWNNDGTFLGGTGQVTFSRNGNATLTGTGANNFNQLRMDMGLTLANTLEVLATSFSAPNGFLQLTNGTLKMSGTFPFTSTFVAGPAWNIAPSAGLWLNNPNVTVTGQAGSVSVRGLLRVSAGTFNVGTAPNESLVYQAAGSSIIVEGGVLNVAGRISGNNASATTSYTQSGGVVTVTRQGSTDAVSAGFDLSVAGSSFAMSGGTLVVRHATSAPADFINAAAAGSITAGTLQIGDALTGNAETIRIRSTRPVANLLVSGAAPVAVKPKAQLNTASLNVVGGITLQTGTTLDAGGLNVSLGGDFTNGGTLLGLNTVTFNGAGAQALTSPGGVTFATLAVSKSGGTLTLNDPTTVGGSLNLTQGTLAVGTSTLTLNGAVNGGGQLTSAATGTVNYNQAAAGQAVLAGNYGHLTFSGFAKTLPATGTIGVAGTFTPGAGVGHTVAGSTFDFNGGSQTVPAFAYENLVTSGGGIKSASGTLTVTGGLTNGAGIQLQGATALTLGGPTHVNNGTIHVATLTIGSGATLTNNNSMSVDAALTGPGTLAQASLGAIFLDGVVDVATFQATAVPNTVVYTGIGQTIRATPYHNLAVAGSGAPSLAGVSTINGSFTLSGTVAVAAAAGLTIGSDFVINGGTSFDAGSFAHVVRGNLTATGTLTPSTSTITLNGSAAQTVSGGSFHNLAIANAAGVALLTDETVGGNLTLGGGALAIGAHALTLNGALTAAGGTLGGGATSNLVVAGAGAGVTLPGLTLNNLTLNRAAGATLSGNVTIDGTLTVTSGTLDTGASAVTLGPTATLAESAGQLVTGTIQTTRTVSVTTGTVTFGNVGADLTLNGVAPGVTTVVRRSGTASVGGGHSSIKRYFDLTPATNSGLNAGLLFHYDATELNGQAAASLELYRSRDAGATWSNLGGTVNVGARTIAVSGLNDLSRWTAADAADSLGAPPTPTSASLAPASKAVGSGAFTLTVNGGEFVNGKAVVRFNGVNRTTAFVNAQQLTAAIPATDVAAVGTFPVTVVNTGGAASNAQSFTVSPLAASVVRVETAADGSGTVVPAQTLASGSSLTVYAITRDALNNFVANVAATGWVAENLTGGALAGDLVPAVNQKSAVFTAHVTGTLDVRALSGALPATPTGTLTVVAGPATQVRVETAANGSGTLVPALSQNQGVALTVFAVARDAAGNFVSNPPADGWSLQNVTGGLLGGDLVPAVSNRSAVFTGHAAGTAQIKTVVLGLTPVLSGTITVISTSGVGDGPVPVKLELAQNYPNPFRGSTTIRFAMPQSGRASLKVFDVLGREVATLVSREESPGVYAVDWDAAGVESGIYFYRLDLNGQHEVRKMFILK